MGREKPVFPIFPSARTRLQCRTDAAHLSGAAQSCQGWQVGPHRVNRNGRSCHETLSAPAAKAPDARSTAAQPLQIHELKRELVALAGAVRLAQRLMEESPVEGRKVRIALGRRIDFGEMQPVGMG